MAADRAPFRLALLVRSPACATRETRAQIDVALAALSLDFRVELYFVGDAVLQLAAGTSGSAAGVPGGSRAWAALPELGEVRVFAESAWIARCERDGTEWLLPVEGLGHARIKNAWRECDRVMVL